jgi:toxin ParE1/3/4
MSFTVRFTKAARQDLHELHAYISVHDSLESADYVAREIVRTALALRDYPYRGVNPPELIAQGNRSYRQIFFKPYRILYRVRSNTVFIALIADGRRNMALLLSRRLSGS